MGLIKSKPDNRKFSLTFFRKIIVLFSILIFISLVVLFNHLALKQAAIKNEVKIPVYKTVKIGSQLIKAELATTSEAMYQGLSDRPNLCSDCGMLFDFNKSSNLEFVMRNMLFPLDIIFIENHHIIKIASNLSPEGQTPTVFYNSDGLADQVLELNANYTFNWGIKVGDEVLVQL